MDSAVGWMVGLIRSDGVVCLTHTLPIWDLLISATLGFHWASKLLFLFSATKKAKLCFDVTRESQSVNHIMIHQA